MGKVSVDDKMRIQTLREQGLGYRAIGKDEWPPNSADLNPLDYHVWGAVLQRYKTFQPKPNTIDELKKVVQTMWDDLPRNSINKAILSFVTRLRACVKAGGRHFEHVFK